MKADKNGALEMDDDPRQENREWIVQRIAWVMLSGLLVAVALGLFGRGGPISTKQAASPDGILQVEYERFMRYHSPDRLHLRIKATSEQVRLNIEGHYARQMQIERITPEPEQEIGEDGVVTFVFATTPPADLHATFHFAPQKYGSMEGWIALPGSARIPVRHFVYP